MKIDEFLLESEPLNKLVAAYIELEQVYDKVAREENRSKQTLFLNSILVSVATKKATIQSLWSQIKYCLEVNSNDRDCLRRGAQLLSEVFKRNSQSLQTASKTTIEEIIQFSCQKALITICGNDFIALIEHITSRMSLASDLQSTVSVITNLLVSNKLQVNTYRQETRLYLYKILLRLLEISNQHDSSFLEKCIKAGEGQKDPRNIGAVFELYLKILAAFPAEKLVPFRAAMFENIEAYYPIEFVGDEDNHEHRKVNYAEISSLLDQCLCHPFFSELLWELLSSKTAAPPLAPFISTILAFFRSLRLHPNPALNTRLASLLFRFSEQEFIAEEYQEHAAQDLSTVVQGLLDVLFCKQDGTFSVQIYAVVRKWLDQMLLKVTTGQLQHSGTMMGLFRAIINRTDTPRFAVLIELVRFLSLKAILRTISDGEIIPKLGLAVVVVTSADKASDDVKELIGLLVLKIGSLYTEVSDQIKLLLLKILLEIYKGSERNRLMVRKANDGLILKDILTRAQTAFANCPNETQGFMVKAFIDFVATVYINEIDLLLNQVTGINFELEGYLLARLWENVNEHKEYSNNQDKIITKLNGLIRIMNKVDDGDNLVKGLKVISKPLLLKLALAVNWVRQPQFQQLIFATLLALRQNVQSSSFNFDSIEQNQQNTEFSHIIYQFFLPKYKQNLNLSKEQRLWRALGRQQSEKITFPLMTQIQNYDINNEFLQKFKNAYPPTFIQWLWEQLKGSEKSETRSKRLGEILRWLPEPLLLRDRKEVLELILTDGRCASSLLKIAKHIDINTIKSTGIVEYCLQYVSSLNQQNYHQNTTERSTCILATLISIAERDKQGELKQSIRKIEKVLKELRQHRKRPIRQAVRRILSILQE